MIDILILSSIVKERNRLYRCLSDYINKSVSEACMIPQINLQSGELNEIRHQNKPDIVILSKECGTEDLIFVKKIWKDLKIIKECDQQSDRFEELEQWIRLGVDDYFDTGHDSKTFFLKLLLLIKKVEKTTKAKIISCSAGKGGQGVTTLAAGIGDAISKRNYKVLLIDFDFQTQDLSRFLQIRPYYNEQLHNLLSGELSIVQKNVEEALRPVADQQNLLCLTPCSEENLYTVNQQFRTQRLFALFEHFSEMFDFIVIDMATKTFHLRNLINKLTSFFFVPVANDPASLYPGLSYVEHLKTLAAPDSRILLAINKVFSTGLSQKLIKKEISSVNSEFADILKYEIPYSKAGVFWPGSERTIYSQGDKLLCKKIDNFLDVITNKKQNPVVCRQANPVIRKKKINLPFFQKEQVVHEQQLPLLLPRIVPDEKILVN